jgi:hypothetical protein
VYQQLDAGDRDNSGAASGLVARDSNSTAWLGGEAIMNNLSLRVVAVSEDALRSELLDALLVDESDCNAVVVESIQRAYSRIRQIEPDLVVVYMEPDDLNACQLLSMLKFDIALRGIAVVTCATGPDGVATRVLPGRAPVGVAS